MRLRGPARSSSIALKTELVSLRRACHHRGLPSYRLWLCGPSDGRSSFRKVKELLLCHFPAQVCVALRCADLIDLPRCVT